MAGGGGDVQRVTRVPAARAIDPRPHLGLFDDPLDQTGGTDTLENDCGTGQSTLRAHLPERVERRRGGGVDHNVRAEPGPGQIPAVRLEVGDDDWFDAPTGQRGDRGEPDCAGPDDNRNLTRPQPSRPHIELADRERVGQGDGVAGHIAGHRFGGGLRNHQQLGEAALRLRMLADDAQAAGSTLHQANGHRRHAGADGEIIRTAGAESDYLADKFVTEHDVAVWVVQRPAGRIVDRQFRVVQVMHV